MGQPVLRQLEDSGRVMDCGRSARPVAGSVVSSCLDHLEAAVTPSSLREHQAISDIISVMRTPFCIAAPPILLSLSPQDFSENRKYPERPAIFLAFFRAAGIFY